MWVAGVILLSAYALIFSEIIHRSYAAIVGAVVMVVAGTWFGFYSQEAAIISIDANTILLLLGMMLLVGLLRPTGAFEYLAIKLAKLSDGSPRRLLVYLCATVSVLSMVLDNVTTVIIFAPLTVLVTRLLHLNPAPYLIAEAMMSNIGGAATLVGDPPNIMIGSAADIDFVTFLVNMAPLVGPAWIGTMALLLVMFRKDIRPRDGRIVHIDLDESKAIHDPARLRRTLLALGVVIVLFFLHHRLEYYPALASFIGLSIGLLLVRPDPEEITEGVDWSVLLFFAALFVMIGGVEASGLLDIAGEWIAGVAQRPGMLLVTALMLMWVAAFVSAIVDNIPFTVTMIPIVGALAANVIDEYPLWWALAIGVGLGGNGTHLGATANIICVAEAERSGLPEARITPVAWLRTGLPVVVVGLLLASATFIAIYSYLL
jgi:Na+/H+ antiporter NhaD/arsenite permease-like protein